MHTARQISATLGSSIELVGTTGTAQVTVTGIGFVSSYYSNSFAEGGRLTPGAYDKLFDGFKVHLGSITLRPGVDPAAVLPRLQRIAGAAVGQPEVPLTIIPPPSKASAVQNVRVRPVLLAAFPGQRAARLPVNQILRAE